MGEHGHPPEAHPQIGILKMVKKVFETEAIPPEFKDTPLLVPHGLPRGVLAMHIKHCKDFQNISSIKNTSQYYLKISVGRSIKWTKFRSPTESRGVRADISLCFDEWNYFSIQIFHTVPDQDSTAEHNPGCENNNLMVELLSYEPKARGPKLMGKAFFNLLDILNDSVVTHQFRLMLNNQVVCKLDVEMVITYGSFGYGYSHVFKHPEKTIEDLVERSLFLRCPPPKDRQDQHSNVMLPQHTDQMDIMSCLIQKDNKTDSRMNSHLMDRIQKRGRLLRHYKALENCETGEDVVQYLENLVMRKSPNFQYSWKTFKLRSAWVKK